MTGTIRVKPLLLAVAIPLVGGFLSQKIAGDTRAVYESLTLPAFAPPGWVFGVVWPLLYVMMGVASYLIWETEAGAERTQALTFYGMQLVLNFLWCPIFFRVQNFGVAFWILCCILVLAIVTTALFGCIRKGTFWLLAPYVAWLIYAAALNRAVTVLN